MRTPPRWWKALSGHAWTVVPSLTHNVRPPASPTSRAWQTLFVDPDVGTVRLTGRLSAPSQARNAVLIVHGLGGDADASYCLQAASAVEEAGWASLRLNMRGADLSGTDIYHAGLTTDLHAALESPELAGFDNLYVVGFSLGGHLSLKLATEQRLSSRVRAVAAVCPPLHLGEAQQFIDHPKRFIYQKYLLHNLKTYYRFVAQQGHAPTRFARVRRAQSIRDWDRQTVVPRFGFRDVEDYYQSQSVRLNRLQTPALLMASPYDPMVSEKSLKQTLTPHPSEHLEVQWIHEGGHVFFPASVRIGTQIVDWMTSHSRSA